MRTVREIQGSRPMGMIWESTKNLTEWYPFKIIGARPLPTKFGEKIEFWLEHLTNQERRGILLSPTSVRQTYVEWFASPDSEPVGPCRLVMGEKCWMFLDPSSHEDEEEVESIEA